MTRVVEIPRLVSWNATRDATIRLVEKIFHGKKPRIFTRQILRGVMRVHACKSEVINERYCNYIGYFSIIISMSTIVILAKCHVGKLEQHHNLNMYAAHLCGHKKPKKLDDRKNFQF